MSEFVIEMKPAAGGATALRLYERESGADRAAGTQPAPPGGPTDIRTKNRAEIEAAGLALYTWLAGALDPELTTLLNDPTMHRFHLDIRDATLYAIAWEILRWPKPALAGSVATWVRQAHHLSRVFQQNWSAEFGRTGPVRVLAIVGSAENDDDVQPEEEITEIRRGIQLVQRTVDFAVIRRPKNLAALYAEITACRPHVVHFIGHGKPDALVIQGAPEWDWTAGHLVDLGKPVLKKWTPRLVFLNACRTGMSASGLASMAGAFISNGVVAAIAMQGSIKGAAAGHLAATFYRQIALGDTVDEALSHARSQVAAEFLHKEAAYPVLTLACRADRVLPRIKRENELGDYRERLRFCPFLSKKMRAFVDQIKPRRKLCDSTWPQADDDIPYPLIVLYGGSGYGKTLLSAWLLDLSFRVGHQVRYVRVLPETTRKVDIDDLLRNIWGRSEAAPVNTSPLMCPLNLDPDRKLGLADAIANCRDANNNIKDSSALFEKFRVALRQAAAVAPITLVLDEFGMRVHPGIFRLFWTELLVYLGGSELPGVTIVLVLSDEEYKEYVQQQGLPAAAILPVELKPLEKEVFLEAFRDYVTFRAAEPDPNAEAYYNLAAINATKWAPLSISTIESKVSEFDKVVQR